ncbi:MAG TPA: hypothetical protein VKT81_12040, partial [Bryobacteraceae bacterium]|nr:hypothetical protein [Bryobacteraceae bacterium]
AALAFAWQALTVRYNYNGNWTALFGAGALFTAPPEPLASEHIYQFPNSRGYDGQIFHIMAHDPFMLRGFWKTLDSPRYRYRRFLIPTLAWTLALGQDRFVDGAYISVILVFLFLGAYWLAALAQLRGRSALWALGLFAVPAVTVSLDRMTVDGCLIALIAGFVYYVQKQNWVLVFLMCALCGLTRETGLLIPLGVTAWLLFERNLRRAIVMALSVMPTLLWFLYVSSRAPGKVGNRVSLIPFKGVVMRMLSEHPYQFNAAINMAAMALDYLALAGIIVGVLYCQWSVRRLGSRADGWVALFFAALVMLIASPDVWRDAFSFARVFSPLLFLTALDGLFTESLPGAVPILLTAPRIWLQFGFQVLGILRGVFGS